MALGLQDAGAEASWLTRCIDHEDVISLDRFDSIPEREILLLKLPVSNSSGCDLRAMRRDSLVRYMQRRYGSGDQYPLVERGTGRKFFQTQVPGLWFDGVSWDYLRRVLRGPLVEGLTTMHVADRELVTPNQILGALQRPQYALEVYVLQEAACEAQFWRALWDGMESWLEKGQDGKTFTEWWQGFTSRFTDSRLAPQPPGALRTSTHTDSLLDHPLDLARWNDHKAPPAQAIEARRQICHFCGSRGLDSAALKDFWPGINEVTTLREVMAESSQSAVGNTITLLSAGSPEVNGVFKPTERIQLGAHVYKNDRGIFLFRYKLPSWQNVYWYVSWLANFDALADPNPMSIISQWRDFYRVRSLSLLPPADGWEVPRNGGQMPLPRVRTIDDHCLERASAVLTSKPDWFGAGSEATDFVKARMPVVSHSGFARSPNSMQSDDSSDDGSIGPSSRSVAMSWEQETLSENDRASDVASQDNEIEEVLRLRGDGSNELEMSRDRHDEISDEDDWMLH